MQFMKRHQVRWSEGAPAFLERPGRVTYNPSFARCANGWVQVWREAAHWSDDAEAMVLRPEDAHPFPLRSSPAFADYSGRIADPKLWQRNEEIWVTFNTGWVVEGNAIFVAQVWPQITAPEEVLCTGQTPIEKNWGFFQNAAGEPRILYRVAPAPTILKPGPVIWEVNQRAPFVAGLSRLSLGSQPVAWAGRWYFTAHRKPHWRGKRMYFGELWSFAEVEPDTFGDFRKESGTLVHSLRALWGHRNNRNRNLISCVYLSGLAPDGEGGFYVGYGVNDREAFLAHVRRVVR